MAPPSHCHTNLLPKHTQLVVARVAVIQKPKPTISNYSRVKTASDRTTEKKCGRQMEKRSFFYSAVGVQHWPCTGVVKSNVSIAQPLCPSHSCIGMIQMQNGKRSEIPHGYLVPLTTPTARCQVVLPAAICYSMCTQQYRELSIRRDIYITLCGCMCSDENITRYNAVSQ